jgi:hypothetical protein
MVVIMVVIAVIAALPVLLLLVIAVRPAHVERMAPAIGVAVEVMAIVTHKRAPARALIVEKAVAAPIAAIGRAIKVVVIAVIIGRRGHPVSAAAILAILARRDTHQRRRTEQQDK